MEIRLRVAIIYELHELNFVQYVQLQYTYCGHKFARMNAKRQQ